MGQESLHDDQDSDSNIMKDQFVLGFMLARGGRGVVSGMGVWRWGFLLCLLRTMTGTVAEKYSIRDGLREAWYAFSIVPARNPGQDCRL